MRDYENTAKALRCCRLTSERGCAECPFGLNNNEKCANLLPDAADAIEELLKENAELDNSGRVLMAAFARAKEKMPQWHPVSKPPKENGRYYVAYEDSVSFLDYFNGKWFFPPRNGIVVEETKESILYWQPFPAPPKEVE